MNGIFRRRHLPHWDVEGHPIFITACLEGSMSAAGLTQIREFREQLEARPKPSHMTDDEWEHQKHKLLFALVDQLLDGEGRVRTPREIISHSIQSYTATMCNRVRGASGAYWQTETFDHWVRDDSEMLRIIDYIEQNPVKANLVNSPEEWRWSSARLRAETGVARGQALGVGLDSSLSEQRGFSLTAIGY